MSAKLFLYHTNTRALLDWLRDFWVVLVVIPVDEVEESESGREGETANLVDAPDTSLPPDLCHGQVGSLLKTYYVHFFTIDVMYTYDLNQATKQSDKFFLCALKIGIVQPKENESLHNVQDY